ncbi:hypothetical protein [uncultured Shimia sp.]|uniref:hypothetical protein n=1 Tax=uncultured Shimia sp. TaxID=573152 RepID=UPI00261B8CE4|nr:hypothetical protein [uncultured Shimia sp.]
MTKHPRFDKTSSETVGDVQHPIVLRFARLKPSQLSRFRMHDLRTGGHLAHVDLSTSSENRIEFGPADWIARFQKRLMRVARYNHRQELAALEARGRRKQIADRQAAGPLNPWHGSTDAPLREGILTVNKDYFGGSGADVWSISQVDSFREAAMAFLEENFAGGQLLYASSHSDEEAFHIHFVTATWSRKTTANRGRQYLLKASENPLLRDYEHAQNLAGEHFKEIGITRGKRSAEARREAIAEGKRPEKKRRHVPPSEYREMEREVGAAEAAVLTEAGRETAEVTLKVARKRVSKEERRLRRRKRQAEKLRQSAAEDLSVSKKKSEQMRQRARAKAVREAARLRVEQEEALAEERRAHQREMELRQQQVDAVVAEAKAIVEEDKAQAMRFLQQAEKAVEIRDDAVTRAKEAEGVVQEAEKAVARAKAEERAVTSRVEALLVGMEMIAEGWVRFRPKRKDKPAGIRFGENAPQDQHQRSEIDATMTSGGRLLMRLAQVVYETVSKLLAAEKAQIKHDAEEVQRKREELQMAEDQRLKVIVERYGLGGSSQ